jgi:predicted RNA methylase
MNWEETIIKARTQKEFADTIKFSYLSEDLIENVTMFKNSEEFKETLKIIGNYKNTENTTVLDIGSGNGISAVAFALVGFKVTCVEPDPSITVGRGAIKSLNDHFNLNIQILDGFGEKILLNA